MAHLTRTALHARRCSHVAGVVTACIKPSAAFLARTAAFAVPLRCPQRHAALPTTTTTTSVWKRRPSPRRGRQRRSPSPSTCRRHHDGPSGDTGQLYHNPPSQQHNHRSHTRSQRVDKESDEAENMSDRTLRRRTLQRAIDAAVVFRQWCRTHPSHPPPRAAPVRERDAHTGAAPAATLADMMSSSGVDHPTEEFGATASSSSSSSLVMSSDVPARERRLLEHYAALLHAVRAAAMRVATSDYLLLYDQHVREALVASEPQHRHQQCEAQRERGTSPARHPAQQAWLPIVPRTIAWTDTSRRVGLDAACEEDDAVTSAERRLMAWAACWYAEVRRWHTRPGEDTCDAALMAAAEMDDDAAVQLFRRGGDGGGPTHGCAQPEVGHAAGDVLLRGRKTEADTSLTELLLQGRWQHAMRLLTDLIKPDDAKSALAAEGRSGATASASNVCSSDVDAALFTAATLRHRRRVPVQPSTATPTPRLPRRLSMAPVTAAEVRLLEHPPSPGLRLTPPVPQRHDQHTTTAIASAAAPVEVQAGCAEAAAPPLSVVVLRLRRRLWVLRHLPRHLSPSLVRFHEPAVHRRGAGGSMPQPYLLRGAAVEWLPWYPVCVLGRVLALMLERGAETREHDSTAAERERVLQAARADLAAALFTTHPPDDYAALHDYTHTLYVTLGSSLLDHAVARACRHDQRRQRPVLHGSAHDTGDGAADVRAQRASLAAERVFAETAMALFAPPLAAAYAEVAGTEKIVAAMTATNANADGGAATASGSSPRRRASRGTTSRDRASDTDITATHVVHRDVFASLCAAVQHWRNYHVSLYCETLSQVADGHGLAHTTLAAILARPATSQSAAEPCVVLAPESAAAVLTAVLLQRLTGPVADDLPSSVFFAVPHDKAYGVAAYFKGTFSATCFARVVPASEVDGPTDTAPRTPPAAAASTESSGEVGDDGASLTLGPTAWHTSAVARLVGRSLRRLDRYPTRTTDAFFAAYVRGDDITRAEVAPVLAVDLYVLNLRAAVAHWQQRQSVSTDGTSSVQQQQQRSSSCPPSTACTGGGGGIVLLAGPPSLPCGLHALFKPAGVTCTLHAHYPCLVYPYLTHVLPWRSPLPTFSSSSSPTSSSTAASVSVPVLRQQGLVNRIDVGTSGVVLVARTPASLHAAADATVRQHRVQKTYRALVQRWPPPPSTAMTQHGRGATAASCAGASLPNTAAAAAAAALPLFYTSPHLCPVAASLVRAVVFAGGADAASMRRRQLRHGHAGQLALESAAGTTVSATASSQPDCLSPTLTHAHERYATTHAALQDVRQAVTRYRVLEHFDSTGVSYVEVQLRSGRRHQIRQHFALIGFPLLGDARYHAGVEAGLQGTTYGMQRAALHAYAVDILAADDDGDASAEEKEAKDRADAGELGRVVVQAPLPADMRRALRTLREVERAALASASASQPPSLSPSSESWKCA